MAKRRLLNNKNFLLIAGVFFALFFLPLTAQSKVYNAESYTLDNGLKVIVIPNHRAPVVTHMVWYHVGAADEKTGSSGMAHYFEHLMFKSQHNMAPGDFSKIVQKLGGNNNAFTGQDYTAYFESIAVEHLEKLMEMEADRMVNLDVPKEHFESEKKVVLEERRQRTDNDPRSIFNEQMRSTLFVNHPYGTPVIGWLDEIKNYEWEDVKGFYDTWYAPNNAIVIISGDVTLKDIKPMVDRTYGKLKPKEIPPRKRSEIPPAVGKTLMTLRHKSINQQAITTIRLAPSYNKNREDALALMVLEQILSGGPTTRLYKNLVVDSKKAVAVNLNYSASHLDYGIIAISAAPKDPITLDELDDLIQAEINDVIDNGVTKQEVKDAIQRMEDAAIYARDSLSGPAMTFGQALTTGSTIDDVENWPKFIAKVTPKDVQRVAAEYLDPSKYWIRPPVTGHVLPVIKEEQK